MFMTHIFQTICILFALTVTIAVGAVGFAAYRALDKLGLAADAMTATMTNVNRPCGGGHPCGTLAEIGKAVVKVGDILVTSQKQEQDTAMAAQQTITAVTQVATHAEVLTDSLAGTSNAATGTLAQAQTDLGTLNGSIAATQPLLVAYTQTGDDLDALLKRKAVGETIDSFAVITTNAATMSGTGSHMLTTFDALETHYSDPVLHPSKNPWIRAGGAIKPYLPLAVKTVSCWAVPGSCL
jgi:hypothetical protein